MARPIKPRTKSELVADLSRMYRQVEADKSFDQKKQGKVLRMIRELISELL